MRHIVRGLALAGLGGVAFFFAFSAVPAMLAWSTLVLFAVLWVLAVFGVCTWSSVQDAWQLDSGQLIRVSVAAILTLFGLAGLDRVTTLHAFLVSLDPPVQGLVSAGWGAVVLGLLSWPALRKWFVEGAVTRVVGGLFLAIVLLIVVMMVVTGQAWFRRIPRSVFVLVAIILPITLYWLFIFTTKQGLLAEFLANMARLGILPSAGASVTGEERARIDQYMRRFEAAYGRISRDIRQKILSTFDPGVAAGDVDVTGGVTNLFFTQAIVPLLMAAVILFVGWIIILPVHVDEPLVNALWSELTPVTAAFLGAYVFSVQLLFRRYLRRDLRASAYIAVVVRFVTVIPFTWVLEATVVTREEWFTGTAFVLGWFPRFFWTMLRGTVAGQWAKLTAPQASAPAGGAVAAPFPTMDPKAPLTQLEGLTLWHEARLEEEDVENVENMATVDLLELMLTTRIAPDRIVDWVDQAILDTQLTGNADLRTNLRGQGILLASQFIEAYRRSRDRGDVADFERVVAGDGATRLRALNDSLDTYTNISLIQRWKKLPHSQLPA